MLPKLLSIIVLSTLSTGAAFAFDSNDEEALANTQKLLQDQQALDAYAKENGDAKRALEQVKQTTGGDPQKQAEMNSISADIFKDMAKANNGDAAAMQAELQTALKDPQAFLNKLTPEQQKRIRELASQIEKKNASAPANK